MKVATLLLTAGMALATSWAVAARNPVLYVEGVPQWSCAVSDLGGALYLPAKELAAALGLKLLWLPKSATLIFSRGRDAAAVRVGGVVCDTGSGIAALDVPILQKSGVTFVPVRAVETMFGMDVSMNEDILLVMKGDYVPPVVDEVSILAKRYQSANPLRPMRSTPSTAYTAPVSPPQEPTLVPLKPVTKVASPSARILSHEAVIEEGNVYIVGEVQNDTDKQLTYVEVDFSILDGSGAQVDTTMTNTTNLAPRGIWKFRTWVWHPENMATYRLTELTAH